MIRLCRNIIACFMITVLLFAVVGLQLHYHTCGMSGKTTFLITETPSCACEIETEVTDSCCENEKTSNTSCHENSINKSPESESYDVVSCCQDEIVDVSLVSSYINSIPKVLNLYMTAKLIPDYVTIKQRFDDYRNHLSQLKKLQFKPRDIVLELIQVTYLSFSLSSDHFTL